MASNNGFIKIYRKMTEWEWYTDYKTFVVFLHLLMMANWKPGRFKGHEVPAGACVTSLGHLAKDTGLSVKNVRTALEHLQSTHEIDKQVAGNFQLIFLRNWAKYQGQENMTGRLLAGNRQATGRQPATIEESKNIRKKENTKRKRVPNYPERKVTDDDFADLFVNLDELEQKYVNDAEM